MPLCHVNNILGRTVVVFCILQKFFKFHSVYVMDFFTVIYWFMFIKWAKLACNWVITHTKKNILNIYRSYLSVYQAVGNEWVSILANDNRIIKFLRINTTKMCVYLLEENFLIVYCSIIECKVITMIRSVTLLPSS